MVSDKGPGPSALRKRISTKTESSEATEVFINRKKRVQYEVWTDTSGERVAELHPRGSLNYFYGVLLSRFPLANHFDLPGLQSIFGISQDPPMCVHASLSRDGFTRKAYG